MHAASIAHGIGAGLIAAAICYLCGLAVVPRRWEAPVNGANRAFIGAALYVLWCWVVTGWRAIPLTFVTGGFVAGMALVAALRFRRVEAEVKSSLGRSGAGWALLFGLFYVLAYVLTPPAATGDSLPPASAGTVDLLTHARYARHLLDLGSVHLGDVPLDDAWHPAVAYLLAGVSTLFNLDPLKTVLPAIRAVSALAAVLIVAIASSSFGLSTGAASLVAGVAISAAFYRHLSAAYALSTLMAIPVFLYLARATLLSRPQRWCDPSLAVGFTAAYVLLWFLDPMASVVGMGVQLVILAPRMFTDREARESALRTLGAAAVPVALLAFLSVVRMLGSARSPTPSALEASGDQLGLISPLAMFGWPTLSASRVDYEDPARQAWAIGAFCLIGLTLLRSSLASSCRRYTTADHRSLAGVAGTAFLLYGAAFALFGLSSLLGRVASIAVLPFAFVPLASAWQLCQTLAAVRRPSDPHDSRLLGAVPGYVAIALVLGNVAVDVFRDPRPVGMPAKWIGLDQIRREPIQSVTLRLEQHTDNTEALARYLLAGKDVDFIHPEVRLEHVPLEMISRRHGLFLQNFSCDGVGHDETVSIAGLGCLLLAPPSLSVGTTYPFNGTFLFISREGMTAREPGGRWNTRPTLDLNLTADAGRAQLDRDLHLNVFLNPYLPPHVGPQRMTFRWRGGELGEARVDQEEWISLPVRSADWVETECGRHPDRLSNGRTLLFRGCLTSSSRRVERRISGSDAGTSGA
jgi:hypothetical protein